MYIGVQNILCIKIITNLRFNSFYINYFRGIIEFDIKQNAEDDALSEDKISDIFKNVQLGLLPYKVK